MKDFYLTWGMLFLGAFMNVTGIYLVKLRLNAIQASFNSVSAVMNFLVAIAKEPFVIAGGVILMVALVPYAIAVARMDLSLAYPVSIALNFLLMLPLCIIFLKETMTIYKVSGILLILVSLYLLHK